MPFASYPVKSGFRVDEEVTHFLHIHFVNLARWRVLRHIASCSVGDEAWSIPVHLWPRRERIYWFVKGGEETDRKANRQKKRKERCC